MRNYEKKGIDKKKVTLAAILAIVAIAMVCFSLVMGIVLYDFSNRNAGDGVLSNVAYNLDDEDVMDTVLESVIPESLLTFTTDSVNHTAAYVGLKSDSALSYLTLNIPSEITVSGVKYAVTRVETLDQYSDGRVAKIVAVVVPDSVTYIADAAFEKYVSLQYIQVPFVGNAQGDSDNDSPFAAIFSASRATREAAEEAAYSKEVDEVLLDNANNTCPWYRVDGAYHYYSLPERLQYVVITNETKVPDRPFFNITSITHVTFKKLDTLHETQSAFHDCTALVDVDLPNTVQGLGIWTFAGCTALKEITLSFGIGELPKYVFSGCSSLETVVIPGSVVSIEDGAFIGCSKLKNIDFYPTAESRRTYQARSGFNLPNGLEEIGAQAFSETAFTEISMSNLGNLESIGEGAFAGCSKITRMSLPFIGKERGNKGSESQEQAMFGWIFGNDSNGTPQTYDGQQVDYYWIPSSLTTIVITNETYVSRGALSNFKDVKTIILNDEIETIEKGALEGCVQLSELSVPFIGAGSGNTNFCTVFGKDDKTGLYAVTINENNTNVTYYVPQKLTKYSVNNQAYISYGVLHGFKFLENLIISTNTTYMEEGILHNTPVLKSLTLPFVGCFRGERSISIYDEWWLTQRRKNSVSWIFCASTYPGETYYNDTMRYYDSYRMVIPSSLESITITNESVIGTWSFRGFSSLTSLSIKGHPDYIAEACAFDCGKLKDIELPYIGCNKNSSNSNGRSYNIGWIFGSSSYSNCYVAKGYDGFSYKIPKGLASVTIGEDCETIAAYAFANCTSIETITLKGEIKKLNSHAFENCTKLSSLSEENATYSIVGDYAFANCYKLSVLYEENNPASFIPSTVTTIGNYAFQGTAIKSINFNQFINIGNYAFMNCLGLTSLNIPNITEISKLQSIGEGVFAGCAYLESVELGRGIATTALFMNCTSLTEVSIEIATQDTKKIPSYMFYGCVSLRSIDINHATNEIGSYAFYGCKALQDFVITAEITKIGEFAFSQCTSLVNMTIPRNVKTISTNGWKGCNKDFFFYVYDPESEWPKGTNGWSDDWNCGFPVYIIGQVDESIFIYDYDTDIRGYLITGVIESYALSNQVIIPEKHNGVKVMGLAENAFKGQSGITSIVLGQYTRVIEDGALYTGRYDEDDHLVTENTIKVYIDVASTSEFVTRAQGGEHEKVSTREQEWLDSGMVYYGEYWDYSGANALTPTLVASKFEVTPEEKINDAYMYYSGSPHTPSVISIRAKGVPVSYDAGKQEELDEKYNVISVALFDYTYSNNIAATTEDSKAIVRGTINSTRLSEYNSNELHSANIDKLYIKGSCTGYFEIRKKELQIFPYGSESPFDDYSYGDNFEFDTWVEGGTILGLAGTNFVFTGTLTTKSNNAGTYQSNDDGTFEDFVWKKDYKVTLAGTDVTKNFTVSLDPYGAYPLTVIINPLDVVIDWTGGSWNRTNDYYLWPYTGVEIVPTATAKKKDGNPVRGIITVEVPGEQGAGIVPTYTIDEDDKECIIGGAAARTAIAYITDENNYKLNYRLVRYDDNLAQYVEITSDSVSYHIKKAQITININDVRYKIGPDELYWSKTTWSNGTTYTYWKKGELADANDYDEVTTYSVSGINPGSTFVGKLRTEDDALGMHNNDIYWELYQYIPTDTENNYKYRIYREDPDHPGTYIEENDYYDVTYSVRVNIVYNKFIVKYYIDSVAPENEVSISDVQGTEVNPYRVIYYQTEGLLHQLIANVENVGVVPKEFWYYHSETQRDDAPLEFKEINVGDGDYYYVGVQVKRDRFDTYYENIRLYVSKSDILFDSLDKEYDGQPVDAKSKVTKISKYEYGDSLWEEQNNSLTFKYYYASDINLDEPVDIAAKQIDAPFRVGSYVVHATAIASEYFNALDEWIEFEITKRVIEIDVRDPNNEQLFVESKEYDSYVYSVEVMLDSENCAKILDTDEFTGILKTTSALPGVYLASDSESWYWAPQWAVYNKSTKENVTSSYTVVLLNSFTIAERQFVYEAKGDPEDEEEYVDFDGKPHSISIEVTKPVTNYTIYYTTDIVEKASDDTEGVVWSRVNPYYTTPGVYIVYFKLVSEYFETVYGHRRVAIIEKEIKYTKPGHRDGNVHDDTDDQWIIDFDYEDHVFEIDTTDDDFDPYYAKVTYSTDGINYRSEPYVFKEPGEYPVYYKITAEYYKTVSEMCTVIITDDYLIEIRENEDFTVTPYDEEWDGLSHVPTVNFMGDKLNAENTRLFYRRSTADAWSSNLNLSDAGNYKVYVRVISPGKKIAVAQSYVNIQKRQFKNITITGYNGYFDNKYHSVIVGGLDAYSTIENLVVSYSLDSKSMDSDDGWETTPFRYKNAMNTAVRIYVKIEAPNFVTLYPTTKVNNVDVYGADIFIQRNQNPDPILSKEKCYEFQYQGQALTTDQIRTLFYSDYQDNDDKELIHDGNLIVKYFEADYDPDEPNPNYRYKYSSTDKLPYAKDLGYYYVEVSFVGSNNCINQSSTAFFRIIPRTLYVVYNDEIQYNGYKLTPRFDYSVEDPDAPQQQEEEIEYENENSRPVKVDVIVDEDLLVGYQLLSGPDGATEMIEMGDYLYSLSLYPVTENYVLNISQATITVIPHEIDIYLRESKDYRLGETWKKNSDWADYAENTEWHSLIIQGNILDGHKLVLSMETSSYEHQTYVYTENPVGMGNYVLISYDVIKVDGQGAPILDEEDNEISVLDYYKFTFDVKIKIVYGEFQHAFDDIVIEYDGEAHIPRVTVDDSTIQNARLEYSIVDPEDEEFSGWVSTLPGLTSARSLTIYVRVSSDNYDPVVGSVQFTIKKANLLLVVDEFDETYDAEEHTVTYTATNSEHASITGLGEPYSIKYYPADQFEGVDLDDMYRSGQYEFSSIYNNAATSITSAGQYFVVILYKGTENYNESFSITLVELKRRGLHVTLTNDIVKTTNYNGHYIVIPATAAVWQTSDLVSGHVVLEGAIHSLRTKTANANPVNKPYYTAEDLDFNDMYIYDVKNRKVNIASNYYPIVTNNVSIRINKISFDFTVAEDNVVPYSADEDGVHIKLVQPRYYTPGDTNEILFFDNPVHFSYYALTEDGRPDKSKHLGEDDQYNVGKYYVVVTFDEGTNYLAYDSSKPERGAIVEVTPVEVRVNWENLTTTYNNKYQAPTLYYEDVLGRKISLVPKLENSEHQINETALHAGNYIAYATFSPADATSINYILRTSTVTEAYKIKQKVFTVHVHDEVYNITTLWTQRFEPEDIEGFFDGLTIETAGGGGGQGFALLQTADYTEGNYLAPDNFVWGEYHIYRDNVEVTSSIALRAEGAVYIHQSTIVYELNESKLTIAYNGQAHSIMEALTIPSVYTVTYYVGGSTTGSTICPTYTNVGTYSYKVQIEDNIHQPITIERDMTIVKSAPVFSIKSVLDREYNGTAVNPAYFSIEGKYNGVFENLVFDFYECDENKALQSNIPLNYRPINVGYYAMRVTNDADVDPDANYSALEEWFYFEITKKVVYLTIDIDQPIEKEQVGGDPLSWSSAQPMNIPYMNLCSGDFLTYTIETTDGAKRGKFKTNVVIEEGASDSVYYLESTKYLSFVYLIKNNINNYDNTSNYILQVSGVVNVRFKYIEYTINDVEVAFDGEEHSGTITFPESYTVALINDIQQKYTYLTDTKYSIGELKFANPGTYTVAYELKLDGYEDATGKFNIKIKYKKRVEDSAFNKNQERYYDGTATSTVPYKLLARDLPDNYDENQVTYIFQKKGTNISSNSITEVGRYEYTITIPASGYYEETVITGDYTILSGRLKITDAVENKPYSVSYNENTASYAYNSKTSTAYDIKMYNKDSGEYDIDPVELEVELVFVTNASAVKVYTVGANTLKLQNGYTITDSNGVDQTANYYISFDAGLQITEGEMSVVPNDITVAYDNTVHMPTVRMIRPASYDNISYSLNENGPFTTENVGSPNVNTAGYIVYIKVEKANYAPKVVAAKVTVTKAQTWITIPNMSKVYDGNEVLFPSNVQTNNVDIQINDTEEYVTYYEYIEDEDKWYHLQGRRPRDVGKYKVVIEVPDTSPNYSGKTQEQEFEITPITLLMAWNEASFIYNGKVQIPSYTVGSLTQTALDVSSIKPAINIYLKEDLENSVDPIDVGVYYAKASINTTDNYVIADNYTSVTYSIQPRTITISLSEKTSVRGTYKAGEKYTFNYDDGSYEDYFDDEDEANPKDPLWLYKIDNLCEDHVVYPSPLTTIGGAFGHYRANGTDIGDFRWDYGILDIQDKETNLVISNYKVTYNLDFLIDYSEIRFSKKDYIGEYDGEFHKIEVNVFNVSNYSIRYAEADEKPASDDAYNDAEILRKDVRVDGDGKAIQRTIYFRIEIDGNYEVAYGSAILFIQKQKANIALSSVATLSKIYDGQPAAQPAVTYNGMEENPRDPIYTWYKYIDKENDIYEESEFISDVGDYRLEIALPDGNSDNYDNGFIVVPYVIQKRDIVLAVRNDQGQVVQQNSEYNGREKVITIDNTTVTNLVAGETIEGEVRTRSSVVGRYNAATDFVVEVDVYKEFRQPTTSNYNITLDMDYTITPATIVYDEANVDVHGYYNGYAHKLVVKVLEPENGATVYYWTTANPTPTTTPVEQKYRGQTTVFFRIEADNYKTIELRSGIIDIKGIQTSVGDNTPLIYDTAKVYDTKPYMDNANPKVAHPRISTPSTGDQVVTYYKEGQDEPIVQITYLADGSPAANQEDKLALIPTNAGNYLFDILVKAEEQGQYEAISIDEKVSFKITKAYKEVSWENLSLRYTGELLAPDAYYYNCETPERKVSLDIISSQRNVGVYDVKAVAADEDTEDNYVLTNNTNKFTITPIEVEEIKLQKNRVFTYREVFEFDKYVPVVDGNNDPVLDENGDPTYELSEDKDVYSFGDVITIFDVAGYQYFVDAEGNVAAIIDNHNMPVAIDGELPYKIIIRGDNNASRKNTYAELSFVVALKDPQNYVWKASQNSNSLVTPYTIDPFNVDNEEDNIELLVTLPSYVLYNDGNEVKPPVTVKLVHTEGETVVLRELEADEFNVAYANNKDVGKNASVTVTGRGNFDFTATHTFEIRAEDPDRLELLDTALVKFVKYVKEETKTGIQFAITVNDITDTGNNPTKSIGEEEIYLGRLHQSQTVEDILNQFVRFDTDPYLFKVWDNSGKLIDSSKYASTSARTGLTIKLYAKQVDADADDDATSTAKCVDYVRTVLYGDLTGDGVINAADSAAIKKVLLGMNDYDSLGVLYLAGLIGDLVKVNAQASAAMKKYLLDKQLNDFNANYLVNIGT